MTLMRIRPVLFAAALWVATQAPATLAATPEAQAQGEFRVCADPNNLPFSNDHEAGFENKLATLIAGELGETVSYTWWAERRGFVRNTLNAKKCDVLMGVPIGYELVETTRPYYRSSYVLVTRRDRDLAVETLIDPRLRSLRIGVQMVGSDGFNTPPAHALADQGITRNVVGFLVYGDYRNPNPPARIIEAVAEGDIDIAAVWGPLAGYFSKQSPVPLRLVPISDTVRFAPLLFQFDIALGVRKGDHQRRDALDAVIARDRSRIAEILADYGVPTADAIAQAPGAE